MDQRAFEIGKFTEVRDGWQPLPTSQVPWATAPRMKNATVIDRRYKYKNLGAFLRLRPKPTGHQIFGAARHDQLLGRGTQRREGE